MQRKETTQQDNNLQCVGCHLLPLMCAHQEQKWYKSLATNFKECLTHNIVGSISHNLISLNVTSIWYSIEQPIIEGVIWHMRFGGKVVSWVRNDIPTQIKIGEWVETTPSPHVQLWSSWEKRMPW